MRQNKLCRLWGRSKSHLNPHIILNFFWCSDTWPPFLQSWSDSSHQFQLWLFLLVQSLLWVDHTCSTSKIWEQMEQGLLQKEHYCIQRYFLQIYGIQTLCSHLVWCLHAIWDYLRKILHRLGQRLHRLVANQLGLRRHNKWVYQDRSCNLVLDAHRILLDPWLSSNIFEGISRIPSHGELVRKLFEEFRFHIHIIHLIAAKLTTTTLEIRLFSFLLISCSKFSSQRFSSRCQTRHK